MVKFCDGRKLLTFSVPPGQVTYIGNINLTAINKQMLTSFTNKIGEAEAFIEERYPRLLEHMVYQKAEIRVASGGSCS